MYVPMNIGFPCIDKGSCSRDTTMFFKKWQKSIYVCVCVLCCLHKIRKKGKAQNINIHSHSHLCMKKNEGYINKAAMFLETVARVRIGPEQFWS